MKLRHEPVALSLSNQSETDDAMPRLLLQSAPVPLARRLIAAALVHAALAGLAFTIGVSRPVDATYEIPDERNTPVLVWMPVAVPKGVADGTLRQPQPAHADPPRIVQPTDVRPRADVALRTDILPPDAPSSAMASAETATSGGVAVDADVATETMSGSGSAGDLASGDPHGVPPPWIELTRTGFDDGPNGARQAFRITVTNLAAYPAAMFQLRPDLPPCGLNPRASRTWVEIYVEQRRIYGYCALDAPDGMGRMGVGIPLRFAPTARVYIVLTDRATGLEYRSNVVTVDLGQ